MTGLQELPAPIGVDGCTILDFSFWRFFPVIQIRLSVSFRVLLYCLSLWFTILTIVNCLKKLGGTVLVSFMIIGAQKCGTTSLFSLLNQHPALNGCSNKEPHFFSTTVDWRNNLERYHSLFLGSDDGRLCFEASTSYTFHPLRNENVWQAIYDYNPKMKFIYIVRSPLDRIVSSYMHAYERGATDAPIDEAVRKEPIFLQITKYYLQIKPYIDLFGRKNVLLVDFDEFITDQTCVLDEVINFLGVRPFEAGTIAEIKSNPSVGGRKAHYKFDDLSFFQRSIKLFFPFLWSKITDNQKRAFSCKPVLSEVTKEWILDSLESDLRQFEQLSGRTFPSWFAR